MRMPWAAFLKTSSCVGSQVVAALHSESRTPSRVAAELSSKHCERFFAPKKERLAASGQKCEKGAEHCGASRGNCAGAALWFGLEGESWLQATMLSMPGYQTLANACF